MIPKEIYTLGAVKFDTSRLAAMQQKLAAQKAAKDEALDKYFTDLRSKINPAGMRTQDTPGFNQKLQSWIANGIQNKNEIAKGGLAKEAHLLGFQDLLNDVEQSKQIGKLQGDLDAKKQKEEIEEEDFPTLYKISLPIYDPRHYKNLQTKTPYSMADFSANFPAWDFAKRKQLADFANQGIDPVQETNEVTTFDPVTKRQKTTYELKYSPEQLKAMADRAIVIASDRSAVKTYRNIIKEGQRFSTQGDVKSGEVVKLGEVPTEDYIALAKAYSTVNPNDVMDTPLKAAMADIVLNNMAVTKRGREVYAKPQGTIINVGGATTQAQQELSGNALDEVGIVEPVPISTKNKKGLLGKGTIENGVARDDKGNLYTGEVSFKYDYIPANLAAVLDFNKTPLNKFSPIIVQYRDGEAVGITQSGKAAINRRTVENAQLKYNTETLKGQQPAFGRELETPSAVSKKENSYSIKGKNYTESQLLKMGYTKEQIAPYIKK